MSKGWNYHADGTSDIAEWDGQLLVDNPANTPNIKVKNDGTGNGILIDQNGNGTALNIDSEATTVSGLQMDQAVGNGTSSLRIKHGGTDKFLIHRTDAVNENVSINLGSYHLWVDSTGDLRISGTYPTGDTSGSIVGTQS